MTKMDKLIAAFDARYPPGAQINTVVPIVNKRFIENVIGFSRAKKAIDDLRRKIKKAGAPFEIERLRDRWRLVRK